MMLVNELAESRNRDAEKQRLLDAVYASRAAEKDERRRERETHMFEMEEMRRVHACEIEDMRKAHACEIEDLKEAHREEIREVERKADARTARAVKSLEKKHEKEIAEFKEKMAELQSALADRDKIVVVERSRRFAPSTEQSALMGNRCTVSKRASDKEAYDGTPGYNRAGTGKGDAAGGGDGAIRQPEEKAYEITRGRQRGGRKIVHYEKLPSLPDVGDPGITCHRLDEYYTLKDGEHYVMRDGKVDASWLVIGMFVPSRIRYEYWEVATVRGNGEEDRRTNTKLGIGCPVEGVNMCKELVVELMLEKYRYNTTFSMAWEKYLGMGLRIGESAFVANVHRVLAHLRGRMLNAWERSVKSSSCLNIDETAVLVRCDGDGDDGKGNPKKRYRKRYMWVFLSQMDGMVLFRYEDGSRGLKAVKDFMENYIGVYTTDGYVVYKVLEIGPDADGKGGRVRTACLVHIRRYFVMAIEEDPQAALELLYEINRIFVLERGFKEQGLSPEDRSIRRRANGSVADILKGIKRKLDSYEASGYAGLGELMRKAVKYALSEWPAMENAMYHGEAEISNNIAEIANKPLKMNLRNGLHIGSGESAKDNAFFYSMKESCRLNGIDIRDYLLYLLEHINDDGFSAEAALPCNLKDVLKTA